MSFLSFAVLTTLSCIPLCAAICCDSMTCEGLSESNVTCATNPSCYWIPESVSATCTTAPPPTSQPITIPACAQSCGSPLSDFMDRVEQHLWTEACTIAGGLATCTSSCTDSDLMTIKGRAPGQDLVDVPLQLSCACSPGDRPRCDPVLGGMMMPTSPADGGCGVNCFIETVYSDDKCANAIFLFHLLADGNCNRPPGLLGATDYFRGTCSGTRISVSHQECSQGCTSCTNKLAGDSTIGDCIFIGNSQWIKLKGSCSSGATGLQHMAWFLVAIVVAMSLTFFAAITAAFK